VVCIVVAASCANLSCTQPAESRASGSVSQHSVMVRYKLVKPWKTIRENILVHTVITNGKSLTSTILLINV